MFSGIIKYKSKILDIKYWIFTIENNFSKDNESLEIGQSIAHDWACMTVLRFNDTKYSFFAMEESFKKTNFWDKKIWDYLNTETSLKFDWKVDWHFVTGHIDSVWKINKIKTLEDKSKIIRLEFKKKFKDNIIEKGSIAINWVSLTVINLKKNKFSVSLIPLTQDITNLWNLKVWDKVNLEFDMMWKYILKYMKNLAKPIPNPSGTAPANARVF